MMETLYYWWMLGVLFCIASLFTPSKQYLRAIYSHSTLKRPAIPQLGPITILLPIRNESYRIKRKLQEIVELEYPANLKKILVVDSGSIDNSGKIAKKFLENKATGIGWEVEILDKPGKTFAINHALGRIDTEIFVMMDADASIPRDSLLKLVSWFEDPSIGGVCGSISLDSDHEKEYRKRFNAIRVWESFIDSTPIFEGSICAFRTISLGSNSLDQSINADDSQMAIIIRRNGLRAIMDPEIEFTEPLNYEKPLIRKIRRAQGLSRVLWKNRDLCSGKGDFSRIYRGQFYFHILFPWLLFSSLLMILSSSSYWLFRNEEFVFNIYGGSILSILLPVFSKTIRQTLMGASSLIISHVLYFSGKRLNVWSPDRKSTP